MSRKSKRKVDKSEPSPECIVCGEELGESHQLVFDEVGIELELQKLILQCFELNVIQDENQTQAICTICLNDLIETVDIQGKEEEEHGIAGKSHKTDDISVIEETDISENLPIDNFSELEYNDEIDQETEMLREETLDSELDSQLDYDADFDKKFEQALGESSREADDDQTESKLEAAEDDDFYVNVVYLEEDINFDFKEYKSKSLNSKFEDIVFPTDMNCQVCNQSFAHHVELMEHIQIAHCQEDGTFVCPLNDECAVFSSLDDMEYHVVFSHYDLNKLSLYAQCPSCTKRFSSFASFNKHSCCDTKCISRVTTQCEDCGLVFQSNKRYRFHLQFHLDNHRPKGCLICDTMFAEERQLYEHLFYSHEENIGYTCVRCDVVFTTEENLKSHINVHEIERPFKCQICPRSYLYNQQLKDHVLAHHVKKESYQCHICGKNLFKQTHLNKHIMMHDKPEEKEVSSCSICGLVGETTNETENHIKKEHDNFSMDLISIDTVYCCEYCELAFHSPETLRAHRDTHAKNEFFCNLCPSVYDEYKKLKTHKLTHVDYVDKRKTFPVMRHYLCEEPDCNQSYMQWTSLRSHKRNKHSNKNILFCPKCPEEFKNPMVFNQHMQNVHGGISHACPFCGKKYNSKMAISVHVARKHNSPKIQCDKCSSVFASEYYLQRHYFAVHCAVRCSICNKLLKSYKNLQVHQKTVHNQEKRYFCRYCSKGYYNQCDCLEHETSVHKKVKRYKCELCDYKAVYKQTLTIHMLAHNNENPYKCEICPKAFRRAYGLSLHMRRHYNIRNYVCPFAECGAAYPNQGILNSHLRKKHPNGETLKSRKRKTIAITEQSTQESEPKRAKKSRRKFDVPFTNVFLDDDDGLDEGVIGEPLSLTQGVPTNATQDSLESVGESSSQSVTQIITHIIPKQENSELVEEESVDNPDQPIYIIDANGIPNQAVIVQRNGFDHDYIIKSEDSKIYGDVIEEYEIISDVVIEG